MHRRSGSATASRHSSSTGGAVGRSLHPPPRGSAGACDERTPPGLRTPILVIGIDIDVSQARGNLAQADPTYEDDIKLIEASVTDPALPEQVAKLIPPGARCLVSEDSAHTYETTIASLRGFSRFVPVNGFFVVEDGAVDIEELRIHPRSPRGVLPAINDWLEQEGTSHGAIRHGAIRRHRSPWGIPRTNGLSRALGRVHVPPNQRRPKPSPQNKMP